MPQIESFLSKAIKPIGPVALIKLGQYDSVFLYYLQIIYCYIYRAISFTQPFLIGPPLRPVFSLGSEVSIIKGHIEIDVTLFPETQEALKSGSVLSVDIETKDQDHFSFGRELDLPHHVSMRFSTLERCEMPLKFIFSKDESGASLVKEITHKGTSTHYLNLLNKIADREEFSSCEY